MFNKSAAVEQQDLPTKTGCSVDFGTSVPYSFCSDCSSAIITEDEKIYLYFVLKQA